MPVIGLPDIAKAIAARRAPTRPLVVAIDGPSGSGKSTLARRLAAQFPAATVVEIDDFNSWSDPTGIAWWARFDEQVLTPALEGRPLRYQVRDWAHDEFGTSLAGWKSVPAADVVIIEGVTSARLAARPRLAYSIWVEAPIATRLDRGVARDGDSHRDLWQAWMRNEQEFFDDDKTRANVDLAIDGAPDVRHDPATEVVAL